MSSGRKPVPYPTSLWTEPPGDFITLRPCQWVGFAHEISAKKSNGQRRTAEICEFLSLEIRGTTSESIRCGNAAVAERFFTGGLKLVGAGKAQHPGCRRAFLHGGLKHPREPVVVPVSCRLGEQEISSLVKIIRANEMDKPNG